MSGTERLARDHPQPSNWPRLMRLWGLEVK